MVQHLHRPSISGIGREWLSPRPKPHSVPNPPRHPSPSPSPLIAPLTQVLIRRQWPSLAPLSGPVELHRPWANGSRNEKNWVPWLTHAPPSGGASGGASVRSATSRVLLSYSIEPHEVLECSPTSGACTAVATASSAALWNSRVAGKVASRLLDYQPVQLPHLRGSTNCVRLRSRNICVAHWHNDFMRYYHWLYAFRTRPPYDVTAVSYPFRFLRYFHSDPPDKARDRLQFAAGLAPVASTAATLEPEMLTITYGVADCIAAEANITVGDVFAMLAGELIKLEL